MSYMNKAERRQQILETAKKIVLNEGISALTARHLATQAEISTGQIHHHFGSVSELKASVFLELVRINLNLDSHKDTLSAEDLLIYALGFENSKEEQTYLKLWNDTENCIHTDPLLKQAYQQAIQLWHQSIVEVLQSGHTEGVFNFNSAYVHDIAWRLIAMACGLEALYQLEIPGIQGNFFDLHLKSIIHKELN